MVSSFKLATTPSRVEVHYDAVEEYSKKSSPPFLRVLGFPFSVLRFTGFFPFQSSVKLHPKNIYSILMLVFIIGINLFCMTYRTIPAIYIMFANWTVDITAQLGACLYFYLSFACIIFVVRMGYYQKLERFSQLMYHATEQKGTEMRYGPVASKLRNVQIVLVILSFFNYVIFNCLWIIDSITEYMPELKSLINLLGDNTASHVIFSIFIPLNYLMLFQSALLYWTCCKCLCIEFHQVNIDITNCDLRNINNFKAIASRHCRLLKCVSYLHDMVALYVMCVFALGSLISTIFAYIILLNVTFGFRLLGVYWLFLTACVNGVLCLTAEGLHTAASAAKERVCLKIAESGSEKDVENQIHNIANMICQQSTVDTGITAYGFFTVSKGLLLTIYSFIGTYVVILLQSPPSSTNGGTNFNTTAK